MKLTTNDITAALRQHLPADLHSAIPSLAHILTELSNGTLRAEEAQSQLATDANLIRVLRALAGKQVEAGHSLISFGSGAQMGDVTISGDVAGGNIFKLTVNIEQKTVNTIIYKGGKLEGQDTEEAWRIENERAQEATLQAYLSQMKELLLDKNLQNSQPKDVIRTVARVLTLTRVRTLDGARKARVVKFLYEARLIGFPGPDNPNRIASASRQEGVVRLEEVDLRGVELQGARLAGIDFEGVELQDGNLQGAELMGAGLLDASLIGANLRSAGLVGANLAKANLRGANLQGAILWQAFLVDTDCEDANFQKADFFNANLQGANLQRACLVKADFLGAKLQKTNLQRANLAGAKLQGTDLQETDLQRADLQGVNLSLANLALADLAEANLAGASLIGANLQEANLQGASLQQADFDRANLQRANLQGADLQGANLTALLQGANLSGANLSGANLIDTLLNGAIGLESAIGLPDHLKPKT